MDGVYACTLLKISNSPFCVILFHSRLFVLVFVSFFLVSKEIFFLVLQFYALQSNYIEIIHGESGDMEFFYRSSTRYLSAVTFHILQVM